MAMAFSSGMVFSQALTFHFAFTSVYARIFAISSGFSTLVW